MMLFRWDVNLGAWVLVGTYAEGDALTKQRELEAQGIETILMRPQ